MALTINHPTLKEQRVVAYLADSAAVTTAYASAPFRGKLTKLISIAGAVVDSDRVITVSINGVAITGGAITLTASGSAAGDVVSVIPTALYSVNEDDKISFASDGAGSTSCPHHFVAVIQVA